MFKNFINTIQMNFKRSFDNRNDIKKEDIKKYIEQGAIIIDVRSPQEYKEGHIEGAICIPEYDIKNKIKDKVASKDELIVLYCSTGHRSKRAQIKLEKLGYTNVYNLYEGINQ